MTSSGEKPKFAATGWRVDEILETKIVNWRVDWGDEVIILADNAVPRPRHRRICSKVTAPYWWLRYTVPDICFEYSWRFRGAWKVLRGKAEWHD